MQIAYIDPSAGTNGFILLISAVVILVVVARFVYRRWLDPQRDASAKGKGDPPEGWR